MAKPAFSVGDHILENGGDLDPVTCRVWPKQAVSSSCSLLED